MKKGLPFCAVLYVSLSILALLFPLLGKHTLFFRDMQLLFVPMKYFLTLCWRQQELPLWNPMLFCGAPFLSDIQTGVFYPLSVVFYLTPLPHALNIFVILHYVIAAYFVYALTRHWKCSIPAACLAALCVSLGGYLVSTANILINLQAAIWLPAIFLCFEKIRARNAMFYSLLSGIVISIQFLGGEPQLLLFTLVLVFTYNLIVNRPTGWLYHLSKTTIMLAFIGIVSIGIVAVQLFPTWEMFTHSIRLIGFNFQEATKFSANPSTLFQILAPPPFDIYQNGNQHFSWLLSNYFGLMPLIFAFAAIVFLRETRVKFWTLCLCVSLILALGKHTPLFFLLYKMVPFSRAFRFPEKFMFVFAYAIAFLTAFGFDYVIEKGRQATKRGTAIVGLLAVCFLGTLIMRVIYPGFMADHMSRIARSVVIFCISGCCVLLFFKNVMHRSTFCVLIVVVSSVDLVSAHMQFNPVVPEQFYTEKPQMAHKIGQAKHSERIFVQARTYKDIQGRSLPPFILQHLWRQDVWPNTGTLYNISYVNGIGGTETEDQWFIAELLEKLNVTKQIRFLELSNTRYFVAAIPQEIESQIHSGRLVKIQNNLYQLPLAMPRAYMVPKAEVVPDQAKAVEKILKDDFDPWQFVVLEKRPDTSTSDRKGGKILDVSYEGPNTVKITAQSFGGYLVLLGSFYPGWRVLVNSQQREVLRANGFFRSVFLEPGTHQIVFTYQPGSFGLGSRVSFITLCLVTVGLWVWRPKPHVPKV